MFNSKKIWAYKYYTIIPVLFITLMIYLTYTVDIVVPDAVPFKKAPHHKINTDTKKTIWEKKREAILQTSSQKKIILSAYMCGGSTIFSQIFSGAPNTMFWYEPLDAFYRSLLGCTKWIPTQKLWFNKDYTKPQMRSVPRWESIMLAKYVANLMSCDTHSLPPDTWIHPKIQNPAMSLKNCQLQIEDKKECEQCLLNVHELCGIWYKTLESNNCICNIMANLTTYAPYWTEQPYCNSSKINTSLFQQFAQCKMKMKDSLVECHAILENAGRQNKFLVAKILRLRMDSMEEVLKKIPDAFIVYFVRDPRAIAHSRKRFGSGFEGGSDSDVVKRAYQVCSTMRQDLAFFHNLSASYPGSMIMIHYEDFIIKLNETLNHIFQHISEVPSSFVYEKLHDLMHSDAPPSLLKGLRKANGTASVEKWMKEVPKADQNKMTELCRDVLESLNYDCTKK